MSSVLAIRRSGGTNIVSLPKAVLKSLGLHTGSSLELSLEDNRIVLTPIQDELSLDDVLAGSPKQKLNLTEEDKQWLNLDSAVGKEI